MDRIDFFWFERKYDFGECVSVPVRESRFGRHWVYVATHVNRNAFNDIADDSSPGKWKLGGISEMRCWVFVIGFYGVWHCREVEQKSCSKDKSSDEQSSG